MNTNGPKKIPKASFIVCILIGLILFAAAGIFGIRLSEYKKTLIELDAVVTKVDKDVYVSYYYNTDDYTNIPISMMNKPNVGDKIRIYIDREDYFAASSDDTSLYMIKALFIVGCVFFGCGAVCLIIRRIICGKSNPILEAGKFIYADVDEVIHDNSSYTIRCHYTDFNGIKKQDYVLNGINTNPAAYLASNQKKIKLYIKGKNYRKYYFDETILKV
ncbi:MAG: hypothetical protein NC223_05960 [Butyrivibrio sp.]|nr:hypothetical protein [Butyrivibrio sp.]